jgi:hypothetical protein
MSLKLLSLALAATAYASPFDAMAASTSDNPCEPCQPQGATSMDPPAVGSDLSSLYQNVLDSVKDITFSKRSPPALQSRESSGFCCLKSLDCVNVQKLNIPMCYDKFTTNFKFSDQSFGSLTTGDYESNGAKINLLTGDVSDGPSGSPANIYAADGAAKPNTATLSIPPQYTGTGVGGAVPASELGSIIVFTTVIPGTTFAGPTTLPGTVRVATVNGQALTTTVAPSTISHATTVAPVTTVVTTHAPEATSSAAAAAGHVGADAAGSAVLGALMYALYAL